MKKLAIALVIAVVLAGVPWSAMAASDTGTHDVTVTVAEIVAVEVVGGNITLTINTVADPGQLPSAVTDATTSLDWTANVAGGTTRSITAALDSSYSAGIALKVTVTDPAGTNGTNSGQVTLTNVAQDVYSGITNENCTGATLTYDASLTAMVAPVSETKTVTYTLTDAS